MSFQVQPFLGGNLGLCCSLLALWVPENHFDVIKWNGENSCSEEGREGQSCQGCCPRPARKEKLQSHLAAAGARGALQPRALSRSPSVLAAAVSAECPGFPEPLLSSPLQPLPSLHGGGRDGFARRCHGNTCWGRDGDGESETWGLQRQRAAGAGQMLSLLMSSPPPKSLTAFSMEICSQPPAPFPFLGHWCSVPQSRAHSLAMVLAPRDVQRGQSQCRGSPGVPAPSPGPGGVFGGRIHIRYHSDCTGGIFLVLSLHT